MYKEEVNEFGFRAGQEEVKKKSTTNHAQTPEERRALLGQPERGKPESTPKKPHNGVSPAMGKPAEKTAGPQKSTGDKIVRAGAFGGGLFAAGLVIMGATGGAGGIVAVPMMAAGTIIMVGSAVAGAGYALYNGVKAVGEWVKKRSENKRARQEDKQQVKAESKAKSAQQEKSPTLQQPMRKFQQQSMQQPTPRSPTPAKKPQGPKPGQSVV